MEVSPVLAGEIFLIQKKEELMAKRKKLLFRSKEDMIKSKDDLIKEFLENGGKIQKIDYEEVTDANWSYKVGIRI